jgi:hypothetical protein
MAVDMLKELLFPGFKKRKRKKRLLHTNRMKQEALGSYME